MTIPYKTGRIDNPLQKPIKQGFGHFQAIHWNSETRLGYSNIQCPIPICVVNTPAFLHHFSRLVNGLSKHGVYIPVYRYTPKEQFYCTLVSWEAHIIINWNWVYHGLPNVLTNSLLSFETHTGTFSFLLLLNKWDPQVALFPDSAEGQSLESLDPYLETPPDGFCHFLPQKMCIMYIHRISWIEREMTCFFKISPTSLGIDSQWSLDWFHGKVQHSYVFSALKAVPQQRVQPVQLFRCSSVFWEMSPCYPRQRRLQYLTVQAAEARANLLRRVTVSKCGRFSSVWQCVKTLSPWWTPK